MQTELDMNHLWETVQKADRLLNRLSTERILHLGDTFPWDVTEEDVILARVELKGVQLEAILLGFQLAQLKLVDG